MRRPPVRLTLSGPELTVESILQPWMQAVAPGVAQATGPFAREVAAPIAREVAQEVAANQPLVASTATTASKAVWNSIPRWAVVGAVVGGVAVVGSVVAIAVRGR